MSGSEVKKYADIAMKVVHKGHEIGNHFFTYIHSRDEKFDVIAKDIQHAQDTIFEITGIKPRFLRPPYGEVSPVLFWYVFVNKLTLTLWSLEAEDCCNDQNSIENRLRMLSPGDIVLLHDDNVHIQRVLSQIIKQAKDRGYEFATLSDILERGSIKK